MATEAEIKTMLVDAVDVLATGRSNASSVSTKINTLEGVATGGDVPALSAALAALRVASVGVLGKGPSVVAPILASYARVLSTNAPKTDSASALKAIYDRWMVSGDRITSRQWTRGAASAGGSNVGDGTIRRLTLDERGQNIETGVSEIKTFTCTKDQNNGVEKHEEVFRVTGTTAAPDAMTVAGSGLDTTIQCISAGKSLLTNPSFSTYSGTTSAPTDINGWTPISSINNFDIDTTNYYRGYPGDTTPASLIFQANDRITQRMSLRRTNVDLTQPYWLQIAYNRQIGGTDGVLHLYLGSQSTTVALSAQTGWNLLYMPIDQNLFYRNFGADSLDVEIELTGATTFGLRVDDVLFVPWQKIDTTWWLAIGGSTAFSAKSGGDTFTVTDASVADASAKIQSEIGYDFPGAYLPSCYPAATACSAALAGAGAGNVNNGTHSYKVSYVDATGAGAGVGAVSNTVTVVDKTSDGKVALTAIPVGPGGTTSRKIYRTAAGNAVTGPWLLLTTIADNSTTTYTDNTADASLGASLASVTGGVTVAEP